MTHQPGITLFEDTKVRIVWDDEQEKYYISVADIEGIFRIIQSIPSKKAEPVKRWLAEVGAQRVDQDDRLRANLPDGYRGR